MSSTSSSSGSVSRSSSTANAQASPPPLVLLHPLGSTGAMSWRSVAESLRGAGHRVVTPDLPGHGVLRDTPFTWEHAATTIRAAAESLAPDKPVLVGHSLGAAAAMYAAGRTPDNFAGLVLSGAGACWQDRNIRIGLTMAAAVGALFASVGRRELLAHAAGVRGRQIVTAARAADVAPAQLWRAAGMLMRFDVRNSPPPPIPCAVIVLTTDRRMPPGLQRGLVSHLSAPYVDIRGDHDAPVRHASRFSDGVRNALRLLALEDETVPRRCEESLINEAKWGSR